MQALLSETELALLRRYLSQKLPLLLVLSLLNICLIFLSLTKKYNKKKYNYIRVLGDLVCRLQVAELQSQIELVLHVAGNHQRLLFEALLFYYVV